MKPSLTIANSAIPRFFYGTAWKEERTEDLVFQALESGFVAVDTANQRKHYHEAGAGQGIKKFLKQGKLQRDDLFLQTKFTFARGQDHRKPYNEKDSFAKQVADSFASSLEHLNVAQLDSYVLHGPYTHGEQLTGEDWETWEAMEQLVAAQKVRFLGVSNISANQLASLCRNAKIKPTFVQNRCFARMQWDREVREICTDQQMVYQGFSLLTANQIELATPGISEMARRHKKDLAQIVFRFAQQLGMITLTGTTNPQHMRSDLSIYDFELNQNEIEQIENTAT